MRALDLENVGIADRLVVLVESDLERDAAGVAHDAPTGRASNRSPQPDLREPVRVDTGLESGDDLVGEPPGLLVGRRSVSERERRAEPEAPCKALLGVTPASTMRTVSTNGC